MQLSNSIRRILARVAAVVVLGALAISAAACTSATSSAPADQAVAPAVAPATAPASAAQGAATVAEGKTVVQASCIGQCHGANILNYRTSQTGALRIASSMGQKAGIGAEQQKAIALFFAQ